MTHFADEPDEFELDTDEREPLEHDTQIDPADDERDAERESLRDGSATEQDELDELDETYREVDQS